uniref:Uncharacterized protein n=1 Tax=viral metagenome TaxID=1070528 RepID=A0A6C0IW35_9ZZZZ
MDDLLKRFILFILGCLGVRLLLVYVAKNINKKYLPYLGIIGLIPAIGFITIYLGNFRKTGLETFGQKIWWNNLRPIHSLLYFVFAYLAIFKHQDAWKPLFIDLIIGLNSFILYHSINFINK